MGLQVGPHCNGDVSVKRFGVAVGILCARITALSGYDLGLLFMKILQVSLAQGTRNSTIWPNRLIQGVLQSVCIPPQLCSWMLPFTLSVVGCSIVLSQSWFVISLMN